MLLRYGDLALLALALPIFVAAGWPLVGYAVAAGAWLAQHAMIIISDRASKAALANGERNRALGIVAGTTLGRVWLVAMAILLVGCSASASTASPRRCSRWRSSPCTSVASRSRKLVYPEERA